MAPTGPERKQVERWFISRGLPHFIEDYSASRDVFTRALPLLTLVFLFEVFTALRFDWPVWANALAIAAAFALLLGMHAATNLLRHRPVLARPQSVGVVELALFVLGPPVVPLIFGGKGTVSIATIAINLVLLAVIYVATSYGIVPMTRWAGKKLFDQLGSLTRLLTRALPLLLLFVTFLFLNPDTWQVVSNLYGIFFVSTLVLFLLVGAIFVLARLPRELQDLNRFENESEVLEHASGVVQLDSSFAPSELGVPLSKRQWGNAGLVVLVSQAIQVLFVALMVAAFLILLGALAVRPDTVATWIGHEPHELLSIPFGAERLQLTEELLRVAVFLSSFSALYFTVVALTDATYREEFFREVVGDLRQALAVRTIYLVSIRASSK